MKRQNIQFKGLRHSPSDITGQDGDLLECVNLIHENGEMKPIEMPERSNIRGVYRDPKTGYSYQGTLAAVHNLTDGKKFVFVRTLSNGVSTISNLFVNIESNNESIYEHTIMGEILWVETIGNTLIVGTNRSTHYVLYKNQQYKWLGDKLPQPVFEFDFEPQNSNYSKRFSVNTPIAPGIESDGTQSENGLPAQKVSSGSSIYYALRDSSEESYSIIADNINTKFATIISDIQKAGKFVFPFFIRYAVRMYDGNYAMHSSPILMLPSTIKNPIFVALHTNAYEEDTGSTPHGPYYLNPIVKCYGYELNYKFVKFVDEQGVTVPEPQLKDWSDIIKGVDICISSPIYNYDENYFDKRNIGATYGNRFYSYYNQEIPIDEYGNMYRANSKLSIASWYNDNTNRFYYYGNGSMSGIQMEDRYCQKLPNPSLSEKKIIEKTKDTSIFYRILDIDLNEITSGWSNAKHLSEEIADEALNRLETLPILPDDYISRSKIVGTVSYSYNQRLILGNLQIKSPLWYQDIKTDSHGYSVDIYFKIEKPEKTIYVRWHGENVGWNRFGHYLYYPDPDCKEAIIHFEYEEIAGVITELEIVVNMNEHRGLHGSFAIMPSLQSLYESKDSYPIHSEATPTESSNLYYSMSNTIAMSSVANPFHFPATNFKDIGRTKVVGIAANTLDVSSGQWGQYPLYVFCSDGIIAVVIDGEGKFGGIQAVSADVLREPRGLSQPTLVQTGQALMFLTQRGVMAIGGTQIKCLSEAMNGRHFNPMSELADVDYHVGAFANLIGRTSDDTDFRDFAASGFLAFDYAHNRVLMLRSDRDYQYVYSLNTGLWSKQIIYTNLESFQIEVVPGNGLPAQRSGGVPLLKVKPICAAVNNYTEMFLQDADGWLYKTMEVQGQNSVKQLYQYGYIVSRPIRFGTDEYKTVVNALHRFNHYAKKSFVKLAMYGSRDGVKYGRINSLRGMSYQYFIFVIYTYLKPNERYSYLTVDFETRLTNKLR